MKNLIRLLSFLPILLAGCNKDDIITDPDGGGPDTPQAVAFTVTEYLPGPGQYINDPQAGFSGIATMEQACAYAQRRLDALNFVSLGAWGGSITVKASETIPATGGTAYDFSIAGNAFDTSNEPGIVWVMADSNGNGLPDDTWYELRGSYYGKEGFKTGYSITYYRPDAPDADTHWVASDGTEGTVAWLGNFHSQPYYYPAWVEADSYTLRGSRLPARVSQDPATGQWTNAPFEWGYADNSGEDSRIVETGGRMVQKNFFRISDAVDADGQAANLRGIDFIKVQTAVCSSSGWLGEISTEVCGFFIEGK